MVATEPASAKFGPPWLKPLVTPLGTTPKQTVVISCVAKSDTRDGLEHVVNTTIAGS